MRDIQKIPKTLFITLSLATVLVLGGTSIWLFALRKTEPIQSKHTTTQTTNQKASNTYLTFTATAGKTVLEQLKSQASNVQTKQSSYGEYVEQIGDKKGGTDGKYWLFYVNGKMADKGAADYITVNGDKVEWKFE